MFIPFFLELKAARVPVSLREYLSLLEGMEKELVSHDVEAFYYLARAALVKDERHIDRFDQVFSHVFKGVEAVSGGDSVARRRSPRNGCAGWPKSTSAKKRRSWSRPWAASRN